MSSSWVTKCTDVPQYDALASAADEFRKDDKLHLRNLCNDSSRCAGLTAVHMSNTGAGAFRKIILDYSRQQVTGEIMEMLFDLADAVGLNPRREAFRGGERINVTEDRAVLHHVLRMPESYDLSGSVHSLADTILQGVLRVRKSIHEFTDDVRNGKEVGVTGKPLKHTLVLALEGTHSGIDFVYNVLSADLQAAEAAAGRTFHLLCNVDPVDVFLKTRQIDPEQTLVVIVSKTLVGSESMTTIRSVFRWLYQALMPGKGAKHSDDITEEDVISKHVVAITCNASQCEAVGIPASRVFPIWDWVIGRYSVCSAVGLLPLSLQFSYPIMDGMLKGAHDVDEHFFNAPLRDNIPVLLGLLGVWNSTFMGYSSRAILPYAKSMSRFPAHIQQVDMESNGKRVALDGTPLLHISGEVNFGEPGTNSHHSFFQLMHQGQVVPADFIGFMESQQPVNVIPEEIVSSHDEFMSNFFAQPDALAYGKTLVDLIQEGVPDGLREHMVFEGNRPSSSIMLTRLDAFAVGQLIALYEHRTAVQGFLWGINSFDQYGIELGKLLAKHVRAQLTSSRRTGASVQGFNLSTSSLLEAYLAHSKQQN